MSLKQCCDVCGTHDESVWHLRKRWKLVRWFQPPIAEICPEEEMDICDSCIKKIWDSKNKIESLTEKAE